MVLNRIVSSLSTLCSNPIPSLADLFEAYFGAVYIEKGFDYVKTFLWTLFTPLAREAYTIVKNKRGLKTSSSPTESQTPVAPISPPHAPEIREAVPSQPPAKPIETQPDTPMQDLHVFCTRRNLSLTHKDAPVEVLLHRWKADIIIDGTVYGTGYASTKKAARMVGASLALKKLESRHSRVCSPRTENSLTSCSLTPLSAAFKRLVQVEGAETKR